MTSTTPHYLLATEVSRTPEFSSGSATGHWRFLLRPLDGTEEIEAADEEPFTWGERLDLLTVIRALESLDQRSWVTLVGCTRYVEQGITYGLQDWKENDWRWECFGKMTPVRDMDLWQRLDGILQFHRVDCSQRRFDAGHTEDESPHYGNCDVRKEWLNGLVGATLEKCRKTAMIACCASWVSTITSLWRSSGQWAVASGQ
jgi:ribonuclease HI